MKTGVFRLHLDQMKRQTTKQTGGVRGPVVPPLTVLHIDDDPNDT